MGLKEYFLPTSDNDYTPHILQRFAMGGFLLLILLTFTAVNLQTLLWQASDWLVGAVLPAVVVDLTNQERAAAALLPLERNAVLDEAARLKAEHMAAESYFAHYSPSGVSPWHWFATAGYSFVHAGENLAIHFSDSAQVVEAWMQSPAHRDNIVSANYRQIGVGTARGTYQGYDTVFVVQLFGTPAVAAAPAAPAPVAAAAPEVPAITELALESASSAEAEQVAGVTEAPAPSAPPTTPTTPIETAASPDASLPAESVTVPEPTPEAPVLALDDVVPVANQETEIAQVAVEDELISVYSGFTASSTDLEPAPVFALTENNGGTTAPMIARLATQPNTVLQFVYFVLAGFIAVGLFASVLLEWRQQRPLQVAYGVLMLCVMSGLFYTHLTLTTGAVIM